MAQVKERFSFNLPEGKSKEVVLVELPDGSLIARTAEELELLPTEERGEETPA